MLRRPVLALAVPLPRSSRWPVCPKCPCPGWIYCGEGWLAGVSGQEMMVWRLHANHFGKNNPPDHLQYSGEGAVHANHFGETIPKHSTDALNATT